MTQSVRVAVAICVVGVASCGSDAPTVPEGGTPGGAILRFLVTNQLLAPITVAIDDTVSVIVSGGKSSGLAVSPGAQWLTWTSAKPTDAAGAPIPDDIGSVKIRVTGIRSVLEVTNVINDTTYVTADIFNETDTQVSIGVYDGSTVSCASVLRGATSGGSIAGFTKTGYYRLLPATEMRAYRDPLHCTGPYVAWRSSDLADFAPKNGRVTLVLSSAP